MCDGWIGYRTQPPQSREQLSAALTTEALPLIGKPLFIWHNGRPLTYSLEAALARPAEDVAIVGPLGMARLRYYRQASSLVLLLDSHPGAVSGYMGSAIRPTGEERLLPLWGQFDAARGRCIEGRIPYEFDYSDLLAADALQSDVGVALRVKVYQTTTPLRHMFRFVGLQAWRG